MKLAASVAKFFVRMISTLIKSMWKLPQRRDISFGIVALRPLLLFLDGTVRLAALFQITLMVFLRPPEFRRRLDLGDDRPIEFAAV